MAGGALGAAARCLTILAQHREHIALVLVGTDAADNNIADSSGNFSHISLIRPLGPYDWDLLEAFDSGFSPGNTAGDLIDGIFMGVDYLNKAIRDRRSKHLLILSNLEGKADCEKLEEVISKLELACISIDLIGLRILEEYSLKPEEDVSMDGFQKRVTAFRRLLSELKGTSLSFQDVIESGGTRLLELTASSTRPWKVELTIGERELRIPIQGHHILQTARPPSLRPLLSSGPDQSPNSTSNIATFTTFHLLDEVQTEVDVADTISGYRYGATVVPFTAEDKNNIKMEISKCLSVIGFTKASNITPTIFVGSTVMRFVADSPSVSDLDGESQDWKGNSATVAVSALVQALIEMDSVALVRRVYSRVSHPTLGVLIPTIDEFGAGLIYHDLAFREDIRTFTFPSLPVVETIKDEDDEIAIKMSSARTDSRWKPNEEQIEAMDAFIDAMMLCDDEESSRVGDDMMRSEMFLNLKHVCNPWLQRFFTLLHERGLGKATLSQTDPVETDSWISLKPDDLPGLGGLLTTVEEKLTSGPTSTLNQVLQELNRVMPVIVPTAGTNETLFVKRAIGENDEDVAANRKRRRVMAADLFGIKVEDERKEDTSSQMDPSDVANKRGIGSIDPVGDFNEILQSGLVSKACSELERHIFRLVDDPLTPELLRPRVIQCLRGYRSAGLAPGASVDVANAYNEFLVKWRHDLESNQAVSNRLAFWNDVIITDTSLAPISNEDVSELRMTPEEAKSLVHDPLKRTSCGMGGDKAEASQSLPLIDELVREPIGMPALAGGVTKFL
ncbi:hypothetical protein Aperf_G00000099794 [Anoplocephala perfoliata]